MLFRADTTKTVGNLIIYKQSFVKVTYSIYKQVFFAILETNAKKECVIRRVG